MEVPQIRKDLYDVSVLIGFFNLMRGSSNPSPPCRILPTCKSHRPIVFPLLIELSLFVLFHSDIVLEDENVFEVVSELDNEQGMVAMLWFAVS